VGGIVQQDGTEDGLFGVYVCGESSVEAEVGDGGHISRKSRPGAGCAEGGRYWKSGKVALKGKSKERRGGLKN
jgi:hypothetical protein